MINPWLMILIVAVGVFIASMFRAQQQQQRTRPPLRQPPPRGPLDEPPSSTDVPVVLPAPRPPRRTMPPPLPPRRKVQRVEIVSMPPTAEPVPPAITTPPAPLVSPAKPLSRAALSLREMFRNPQALRAAILVREVLDAPLCRRRHGRGAKGT
jgi:hypothetical protein